MDAEGQKVVPTKKPQHSYFSTEFLEKWDTTFQDVRLEDVPIELIKHIEIVLTNGEYIPIDIQDTLANENINPRRLEMLINQHIEDISEEIHLIEFKLDMNEVAITIEAQTEKTLKDL